MCELTIAPSATFRALRFTDVDEFKQAVRKFQVEFTPLARKISVQQKILDLPDFDISVVHSFPRLMDTRLAPNCTAVCFTMEGDELIRFNGVDVDRPFLGIGHGGDRFSMIERSGARLASILFTPDIRDRGWPETAGNFAMFVTTPSAQQKLRVVVSNILDFAATSPEMLSAPATLLAIKDSLLSAIDQAFEPSNLFKPGRSLHSAKTFSVFRKIEDAIGEGLAGPVYSSQLAETVGVSVRSLQDVILQYRGMSLHRYLRLKRLWLVRQRLLAGEISVKRCAMDYGFWHMGDFSRSYQVQFGEAPSQTLASAE